MLGTKQEALSDQSEICILVQPIRAQYLCLTIEEVELWKQEMELLSDQSEFSMYVCSKISGIVPREIGWAGIK